MNPEETITSKLQSHAGPIMSEINDVLIELTDALGFDHETASQDAYNLAFDKLGAILGRVENAEYQKGRDTALEEIEEKLWLPCCHTSGMHDPTHFQNRKYICGDQAQTALHRFCTEMGINPKTKSDPECGWCKEYPEKMAGEGIGLIKK